MNPWVVIAVALNTAASGGAVAWLIRALGRGDYVQRDAVNAMNQAWQAANETTEKARQGERDQLDRMVNALLDRANTQKVAS